MANTPTITDSSNVALDALYKKTAGAMLTQITAISRARNSRMQVSLKKLDDEAKRLQEAKQRMTGDNAQLQQTLDDYESTMATTATLIQSNDDGIQNSALALAVAAVTAKVFLPLSRKMIQAGTSPVSPQALSFYLSEIGKTSVKWNVPQAIDFVTDYVDSPAWIDKMEGWGVGYADLTRESILSEISKGAGPRAVASKMRQFAENIPVHAAENLTRTLQLTSYRDASLAMEVLNNQYLEGKIRIAKLDEKTCLSCIALHGTPLDVGERVDDHYLGRCTEFYQVAGGDKFPSTMQADSTPGNRRFVPFQTGEEWFASLPPGRQAQQASFKANPAKYKAFQAGTPLSAFVAPHVDPVFGRQIIENSLIGAIGSDASQFYTKPSGPKPKPAPKPVKVKTPEPPITPSTPAIDRRTGQSFRNFEKANDSELGALSKEWTESLTEDERKAVFSYSSGDWEQNYKPMNNALRSGDLSDKKIAGLISDAEKALAKAPPTPFDLQVSRQFNYKDMADAIKNGKIGIGDIVSDKAFVSTTTMAMPESLPNLGERVFYDIFVPKGTKGVAFLDGLAEYEDESEILFPPNTKFKVIGVLQSKGAVALQLEIVP